MNLVYILHSVKLDRFYIGYTSNLDLRMEFHLNSIDTSKLTYNTTDWTLFVKWIAIKKASFSNQKTY